MGGSGGAGGLKAGGGKEQRRDEAMATITTEAKLPRALLPVRGWPAFSHSLHLLRLLSYRCGNGAVTSWLPAV